MTDMTHDVTTVEIDSLPCLPLDKRRDLPNCPAVYFVRDSAGKFLYIGQSERLVFRWAGSAHHQFYKIKDFESPCIAWLELPREMLTDAEYYFIAKLSPVLNVNVSGSWAIRDAARDAYVPETEAVVIQCLCISCRHEWWPQVAKPVVCPRCKSYKWDEKPSK